MVLDAAAVLAAGFIALRGRYDAHGHVSPAYIVLTISLPLIWVGTLAPARAYEARFIGTGADTGAGGFVTNPSKIIDFVSRPRANQVRPVDVVLELPVFPRLASSPAMVMRRNN